MSDEPSVISELRSIIEAESQQHVPALEWDRSLQSLGLDSLIRIRILVAVEHRFGIEIEEEDASAVETVGALVDLIERKRAQGASGVSN